MAPFASCNSSRRFGPGSLSLGLALVVLFLTPIVQPLQGQEHGLRLPGLEGGEFKESDLENGDTILIFWASWSPRCRDIKQRVEDISRRWGKVARVITVNFQEEPGEIRDFLGTGKTTFPVFLDTSGNFSKKHLITTLPSLLVYRDGDRVHRGRLPAEADAILGKILSDP